MTPEKPLIATGSQTIGPFFHFALTAQPHGRLTDRLQGAPIRLRIRVTDGDGVPVDDAMIEVAQDGVFGRLPTQADGECDFETVRPVCSDDAAGHVDVCLFARGLLRHLRTRIYFAGDPALDRDPVLTLVPDPRRATLFARQEQDEPGLWRHDIRLQGAKETVFFDA